MRSMRCSGTGRRRSARSTCCSRGSMRSSRCWPGACSSGWAIGWSRRPTWIAWPPVPTTRAWWPTCSRPSRCRWTRGWTRWLPLRRRWRSGWTESAIRTISARSCVRPPTSMRQCCCRPDRNWPCPVPPHGWPRAVPKQCRWCGCPRPGWRWNGCAWPGSRWPPPWSAEAMTCSRSIRRHDWSTSWVPKARAWSRRLPRPATGACRSPAAARWKA